MPTQKVPPFLRRSKTIGSAGMTDDLNADSTQLELLSTFANTLPDSYGGTAPQWVAGPQKAGALVYDLGQTYRVKVDIINSLSAPAGNIANYESLGGEFWGALKRSSADPQTISAAITAAVNALINGAPGALDALNELAAALGNDPNFATTVTNNLATKAPLVSPALTGTPTAPTAPTGTATTQLATTLFVANAVSGLNGGGPTYTAGTGIAISGTNVISATGGGGATVPPTGSGDTVTFEIERRWPIRTTGTYLVSGVGAVVDVCFQLVQALGCPSINLTNSAFIKMNATLFDANKENTFSFLVRIDGKIQYYISQVN